MSSELGYKDSIYINNAATAEEKKTVVRRLLEQGFKKLFQ